MSGYVALNLSACLATSLLLAVAIWRDRALLLKPSVFVVLFFHLMVQWAAVADAEQLYARLPDPWSFALLAQGFPLIGLVLSLSGGRKSLHLIWRRLVRPQPTPAHYRRRAVLILATCMAAVLAYFFTVVPLTRTGIYAILFDPERSSIAREESYKLVRDPLLRYSFSFMTAAVAPLLAVLLAERLSESLKPPRPRQALLAALGLVGILVAVSPTGARGYPAAVIFAVLLSLYLRRGAPLNVVQILLAGAAVLALPTLLTVLREGRQLDARVIWTAFADGIVGRTFHTPMETGFWHVHYAQTAGPVGLPGVPKLAVVWGLPPVNVANLIGRRYAINPLDSVSANTAYVFSYYCYFGVLSFPFSLLALWLLDGILWVYRRLSDAVLLPCVASVSVASLAFVSSDYTTVLLTHGLALIPTAALGLDRLCGGCSPARISLPHHPSNRAAPGLAEGGRGPL